MSARKRDYKYCQHCKKELNTKRFKEHQRLYFNRSTNEWIKEHIDTCEASTVSDQESDFSYFDGNEALEALDVNKDDEDNEMDDLNLTDGENNDDEEDDDESDYQSKHLVKHIEEGNHD